MGPDAGWQRISPGASVAGGVAGLAFCGPRLGRVARNVLVFAGCNAHVLVGHIKQVNISCSYSCAPHVCVSMTVLQAHALCSHSAQSGACHQRCCTTQACKGRIAACDEPAACRAGLERRLTCAVLSICRRVARLAGVARHRETRIILKRGGAQVAPAVIIDTPVCVSQPVRSIPTWVSHAAGCACGGRHGCRQRRQKCSGRAAGLALTLRMSLSWGCRST